jgi:hypothetical protein
VAAELVALIVRMAGKNPTWSGDGAPANWRSSDTQTYRLGHQDGYGSDTVRARW